MIFDALPILQIPPAPYRRPSDAEFSALAAQAYPILLDRETGRPWWDVALAKRDAEISTLKAKIEELEFEILDSRPR